MDCADYIKAIGLEYVIRLLNKNDTFYCIHLLGQYARIPDTLYKLNIVMGTLCIIYSGHFIYTRVLNLILKFN